ncbi:amino acid permease [Escherichia coli]
MFSVCRKYGGSCQPGSTAHRLGYYWRWHFIAGLCHADPHAHSSELDGGIFTYAREGFGELIGFCSAWGYWLCAVITNVSYLVIVFSALSFYGHAGIAPVGDGNTWQWIVGASALLWIVHF